MSNVRKLVVNYASENLVIKDVIKKWNVVINAMDYVGKDVLRYVEYVIHQWIALKKIFFI